MFKTGTVFRGTYFDAGPMGSQAHTALGILRWTWKTCLPKGIPGKELPRVPLILLHRPLCSSQLVPPLSPGSSPAQTVQHGRRELTIQSLAEMGFSESQAEMVYEAANKTRCKHDVPVLTVLFSLGLNLEILEKCPELYSLNEAQLQQRVLNLRKLGLLEGSLQRVISHYPRILSFPVKRVNTVSRLLREKCQFTAQQMADILRDSPHVVEEEPARLEYMFQYVYFRMGCRQAEMVKAKLFRLSLEELRCRHSFLERRGLYQTPDKKGQTLILNPRLKDFLSVPEEIYLTDIANATQEEFDVFRKLVAREQEEEEQDEEYSDDDDDDDEKDDDDDDDDDEVTQRHMSSKKKTNQRAKMPERH
ncbi:transcription termination factor 4, mitochondrial [Pangasianodon hypophthalmus]|uniref:transcription termination factor 4, mitochondrial n=1 Tax=Pangasianodon hypophthalmus TaxID=310915 RepID=UPI00230705E5|nr:transcription termination factor 4, mitochondrial [Pangasianodon hypophthalmus]